eukprot:3037763-Pyramimonas_sp.AAC.1
MGSYAGYILPRGVTCVAYVEIGKPRSRRPKRTLIKDDFNSTVDSRHCISFNAQHFEYSAE